MVYVHEMRSMWGLSGLWVCLASWLPQRLEIAITILWKEAGMDVGAVGTQVIEQVMRHLYLGAVL